MCDGRGGQTDCARDRLPCSLSRGSLPGGRRPSLEASDQGQEGESGHRSGSGQEASDPRPGDPRLLLRVCSLLTFAYIATGGENLTSAPKADSFIKGGFPSPSPSAGGGM